MSDDADTLAELLTGAELASVEVEPAFENIEWEEKLGFGSRQITRRRQDVREAYDVTLTLRGASRQCADGLVAMLKRGPA